MNVLSLSFLRFCLGLALPPPQAVRGGGGVGGGGGGGGGARQVLV